MKSKKYPLQAKGRGSLPAGRQGCRQLQEKVTNWRPFYLHMYYVYILQSSISGKFYKVQTDNLSRG